MTRRRAETPWEDETPPVEHGKADDFPADGDDPLTTAAGVLWVPEPDSRRGWRAYFVKRAAPPAAVSFGFAPREAKT